MSDLSVLFGRPYRGADGDDRFELEALAMEELGIESYAIPLDPVVNGDPERALKRLPRGGGRQWLYRGWLLNEEEYTGLYEAILERGDELVVDPDSFALTTYAPAYLPLLGERTAPARWTEGESIEEAWEVASELGPPPWVVKDHVKSAKEAWHRACFVPAGADFDDFAAICETLLELRGDRFERGFVVKKYLELRALREWTPERRRVTDEHRVVFWRGRPIAQAPYYDVDTDALDLACIADLGRLIDSPFFTADVARLEDGGTTIVELNDGGCSVLPERLDPRDVYRQILRT